MHKLLSGIWAISALLTFLGCIPYLVWVIYTAIKKRWKRVGLQLGIPLAFYALLLGASAIASVYEREQYFVDLFDAKGELGTAERAFNGDGYSFSAHELPASIRTRFESPDDKLLSEFPKRPSERSHWSEEHWRSGPFDERFNAYLNFALTSYDAQREPALTEQFVKIRELISRKGAYYAFFYNSHGDRPGNIDFFLVDLTGNRLYVINHNT
jgi:hypothetical protein